MRLPPAEQEEFESLLLKGTARPLSGPEEARLRHLVGLRNPGARALPLPQLVNAGLVAHGADVLLRALVEE